MKNPNDTEIVLPSDKGICMYVCAKICQSTVQLSVTVCGNDWHGQSKCSSDAVDKTGGNR